MSRYDPDLSRKLYSVEQIASSYQASHQTIANMPPDDEFTHALAINGHGSDRLEDVKREYRRLSAILAPYFNR